MDLCQPFFVRQPEKEAAAPRPANATPVLKLRTTGPGNLAYLEPDGSDRVMLHFRGLAFDVDDYVPHSLAGRCPRPAGTAGQFVCRQMLTYYGYREEGWPALARRFLLQHAAHPRAAMRSRG